MTSSQTLGNLLTKDSLSFVHTKETAWIAPAYPTRLIVEKGANAQAHVHESFLDVTAAVSVRNVPVLACRWDLSV
jgi:hypothetical protein